MEAVRRRPSKKSKNKAGKANGVATHGIESAPPPVEQSVDVSPVHDSFSSKARAYGSSGDAGSDSRGESVSLGQTDSQHNGVNGTSIGVEMKRRGRSMDDDIAQNEDDLMALLISAPSASASAPSSVNQARSVPSSRLHSGMSIALEDAGTLTATSVPSAPNFDDSDDEDHLPTVQPTGFAQRRSLDNSSAQVEANGNEAANEEVDTFTAVDHRPSAPPDPSDSPLFPLNGDAHAVSMVPSAPLEDEDFDVSTNATPLRIVVPSVPNLSEEGQPSTVIEASTVALKSEASTDAPSTAKKHRVKFSPPKVDVEKAGETVRNTFAKSRVAELGTRLYPAVADETVKNGDTTAMPMKQSMSSGASTDKYPIFIKLEPHSNYEMNIMKAAASQKPQQAKMHSIEINKGDLYSRLERYLFSEYLLHSASSTLESRKKEVEAMIEKVWLLELKRLSATKRCGDDIEMEEVLEFQTARFDPLQHAKLKAHLESLRQLRTVEASLHTFDRALSYFHVEQYLNEVLQERSFVSYLNKMSASSMAASRSKAATFGEFDILPETISFYEPLPAESTLASSVDHLKYCIDVMIFFEKKVTVDDRGLFGRVPASFSRGELVWHSNGNARPGSGGNERRIKCYACSTLNPPMEPNQYCKFCASCGVALYLPPSSVSTKSNDWYASVLRFRQSLQKWISLCLRTLLRLRSLVNMPYVLMHVMYLPRVATEERSWILRFLQFPKALVTTIGELRESWTEDLVDHYVAMMHLVFHPEKLRRLTTLVSSEIPTRHKGPREKSGDNSLEWVLLENPDVLDRWYLSDEDFVEVINQFPNTFAFEQVFSTSMDTKKCFSRALALVIEFTQGLRLFQEFEKFPARVAELLGELLLNASLVSAASSSGSRNGEGFFYPTLFDQLFLTALHGLLVADCNRVAWRSLRDFPFAPLSALAKWDVLALLLFGISSVPSSAKSTTGWADFISHASVGKADRLKAARTVLYDHITSDPDNAMHLMHAVARLAASANCEDDGSGANLGRDLVLVATQELFLAGYVNSECRKALGESGERAARPISTLCLAHPWVISELISLLFKYHECVETWIHVFETFPVNRWLPSPSDLSSLQEWLLLDDTSAPRSAVARFLLDRINWEFDVKSGQLFTNPYLHRQVGLVVAEALLVHRSRRLKPSREMSLSTQTSGETVVSPPKLKSLTKSIRRVFRFERPVDFERWCWKLILKLKFYSPRTHEPFVDLVDLKVDRSREALLLRRWFPGGIEASMHGAGVPNGIHFYPAQDEQVQRRGLGGSNQRVASEKDEFIHRAALAGSGSSGAPIQDEASTAVMTTGDDSQSDLTESAELVSSVAVSSTCEVEPIVAYLICQTTTFVFSDRMDRWEPLLVLLKNGFFEAGVKVLDNVLPLVAKLSQPAFTQGVSLEVDHGVTMCMASMDHFSTDQMLLLVQALERHSFISSEECQLLSDLLEKGYIGGWESTAKAKVLEKLRFVRECSTYLHPLVIPSLVNESFPRSATSMMSTAVMFQGAMSWLTSALRGGRNDPPSPSAAHSITSALTIRKSHLVATVPTVASAPAVTAAAAAASLGIVDAPGDYSISTQQLCNLLERAFANSMITARVEIGTYWMKLVLQVPLWYEHPALRHIVDVLLQCSVRELYASRTTEKNGTGSSSRGAVHRHVVSILSRAYSVYCHRLKVFAEKDQGVVGSTDADFPPVASFLPVVSSVPALASIFGGNIDAAQYVVGCSTFAFWALLTEVRQELPLFLAMGRLLIKFEPVAMKKIEKIKKTESKLILELAAVDLPGATNRYVGLAYGHAATESLSQFKIYRWAEYCLQLSEGDEIQILFWQVFFALYFACAGGSRVFGHYFLEREESSNPKHVELRKLLQSKLRSMTTYSSNQAQLVLTATGGSATGNLTSEGKELKYHHFVQLSHIYTAMDAWLEEREPNKWLDDAELATLPRHFEVARLREVLTLSDRLLNTLNESFAWDTLPLWYELCGFDFQASRGHVVAEDEAGGQAPGATTAIDHYQEEDFAFVEDRDMRRYSSLGSSADHGRTNSPLALTAEYAGPVALTVLPQVSVETTPERCMLTPSVPLNKHGLKTLATKFSETLSILIGLDAEVLDHVSKLYISKPRVITESKPCIEGTNCRKPAPFRFEFTEWSIDKELMDTIQSTIVQAERYDMRSMEHKNILSESLATQLLDTERRRNESSLLFDGVDAFLQLDADGVMLSMQILLIDHAVQMLEAESERLKRALIVAQATASNPPKPNSGEPSEGDSSEGASESAEKGMDPTAKAVQDAEYQVERLHDKGLEWFRQLTELDTRLARMVPPLREVLWRSIKQLGMAFVCVDERETCNLLNLMLEDPSRITLLSECFSPASAPTRFVEMFSNLMNVNASSKLSSEDKLILLQRFDFQLWLSTKAPHTPTKFDRDTILSIILGDIGASSYKNASPELVDHAARARVGNGMRVQATNKDDEVLRLYAKVINQICTKHLGDHLEKILHALVGVHVDYRFSSGSNGSVHNGNGVDDESTGRGARPAPAIVWEAVVSIPASTWQQIPFVQVESCVSFLNQHMTSLRWQASMASSSEREGLAAYPIVAWQRRGALKSYLDLFTQLSRTMPEQNKWSMITSFFEPLLVTLYQPSTTTEGSSVSSPWSEPEATSTGTTLCSCFVAICTDYLKPTQPKANEHAVSPQRVEERRSAADSIQAKLDLVWKFYVNTLVPHAPVHVCKSFHQFLTRLGWEQWCLTIGIVQQMREIVQSERQQLAVSASCADLREAVATSPYPYVSWMIRDVLCRMTWKSTEDWLATQSESIRSVFLTELAKICVDLVLDLPHFQPPQSRSKNGRGSSPGASNNVLPPYFVNFIKQQSSLWSKWKINDPELDALLSYVFDAVMEPIRDLSVAEDAAVFPANPSVAVMQDAFSRLQLVLRLASQVTTLNHTAIPKADCLKRSNLFLKMAFAVFETGMTTVTSAGEYAAVDPSAWTTVLFGATCTVLYEKLDEIVQVSRVASDASTALAEDDLLPTLVEVLRLFNLRLVEGFFRREQQYESTTSSLVWGKCGNIIFVEVDSLIRDFSSAKRTSTSRTRSGDRLLTEPIGTSAAGGTGDDASIGVNGAVKPGSVVESMGTPLGRLLWCFMGFRGGELCCLSACGRAIASVQVMSLVAERSVEKWIIEERRGGWDDLVTRLKVPELSEEEFESACLQQGNLLTLQLLFLQQVKKAPAMTEAFAMGILSKLMTWMEKLHLINSTTSIMDMKMLFMAAAVTNFVHKALADVLPSAHKKQMLRELCNIMLRFGNARRQHGIMKAIGIGGSLKYSVEFHVCSLTIGIFLRLQTRNGAPLRVDERIPFKLTRTTDKHLKSLEQLLASKNCFHLQKKMEWLVGFLRTPSRSLADQDEFFVSLFSRMYPSHPWLLAKCVAV